MQLDADGAGNFPSLEVDFGHGGKRLRDGVERGGDVVMVGEERGRTRCLGAQGHAREEEQRGEALADFGKVSAERFAGALVVQQAKDLGGYAAGSEIVLDEFGDGTFSGD